VTYKKGLNLLVRSIANATTLKKAAVVCLECVKTLLPLVLGVELTCKLTNGDMNEISQWRQAILNDMFPEDLTKDWTEPKAETAMYNLSMGYSHETAYKPGDVLLESSNSKKSKAGLQFYLPELNKRTQAVLLKNLSKILICFGNYL
jgi:hypothetical protein